MGNQPSRSGSSSTSNPQSPAAAQAHAPALSHHGPPHGPSHGPPHVASREPYNPRRRESIQALSVKASAAPPSASLESARPLTLPATVSTAAQQPLEYKLRGVHETLKSASEEKMGNEQSRHKGPAARDQLTPPKPRAPPPVVDKPSPSPQTKPVDVPSLPSEKPQTSRTETDASSIDPQDASQEYFPIPPAQFGRPPRLPLPIEEEVHTPGSPILSPTDLAPLDIGDVDGVLPRRTSVLSSTTAEEDDLGDEFQGPQDVPTVPTLIEWEGPGERVYVTGTFAGWDRKYRLHRK